MRGPEAKKEEDVINKPKAPPNTTVYKNRSEFLINKLENPEESKTGDTLDYEDHCI